MLIESKYRVRGAGWLITVYYTEAIDRTKRADGLACVVLYACMRCDIQSMDPVINILSTSFPFTLPCLGVTASISERDERVGMSERGR